MAADSDFAVLPTTILRMYDSFGHFKLAEMMGTAGCLSMAKVCEWNQGY
jgi:hypothetical protein